MTLRHELINHLIRVNNYKSYLEIGTNNGDNFRKVKCDYKACVDPVKKYKKLTYHMDSDKAFELLKNRGENLI